MKKKLFLLGFIFLVIIFGYSFSKAQIYLYTDTLKVGSGYYANEIINVDPGDKKVPITVYLRNTFNVGAFVCRLVYDTTIMYPYPPAPESSFIQPSRSQNLTFFGCSFDDPGVIRCFGSRYVSPEYIAEGRGPIVELYFNIKFSASEGCYSISFEGDTLENSLTDVSGTADYIPVLANGTICVGDTGPIPNNPPVIAQVGSQTVIVGQSLSFQVNATDQDGDLITLSAQSLPANSTFPQVQGTGSVSGTFTFIPTAEQAPDTFLVTFVAMDEHLDGDQMNVSIFLYEEEEPPPGPTDKIKILSTEGGVPGSSGRLVPFYFVNQEDTVYGIEFSINYNHQAIIIDSLVPAERINGFSVYSNLGNSLGKLTVLIFSLTDQMILPGSEDILYLAVSVDTLASFGESPLNFTQAWEVVDVDSSVTERALSTDDGVFIVDRFGDVNLNQVINIGDIVALVNYLLEKMSLSTRSLEAAEINRDGDVNVGDLVGVINTILGRPINAPLDRLSEPLAYLHLEYDSLTAGSSGEINVWADLKTPVSGVQLKIEYDPDQLSFSLPELTSRSAGFDVCYEKDEEGGSLTVIFYRYYGQPIDLGQGSILSLPVVTSSDFDKENLQIQLKEAILADPEAVVIPVDKGEVPLPKYFNLSQNYPNPFNPNTTIRFEIGSGGGSQEAMQTSLKIYNILGQVVKTLVDEPRSPGVYDQTWDSKNEQGEKVSSGIYFYQLRVGDYSETKKMVLLK